MTRILLIGAQGQLGQALLPLLPTVGEVTAVEREQLDLTQLEKIEPFVTELQPQIIINAAAYTAVDKAESKLELANRINGIAPGFLAQAAQKVHARLVHISTDYVFDGSQNRPYLETDSTNPLSVYGQSKLAGETAIQAVGGNYIILRTAWVYGAGRTGNFVKTMLRLGAEREELRVVYDQVGSPTWTQDLARAIMGLMREANSGIYHYTNSGVISWYDFAMAIFEEAEKLDYPLKIQRIIPITTAEYPTPAKRPAYSVLSIAKTASVLGTHPPYWRKSLQKMLPELLSS